MAWSKIWLSLLAVCTGVLMALLLVVPRSMQREVDTQVEARLFGADGAAGNLLRVYARKWIDAVAQVAGDADLYEALAQASRPGGNADAAHQAAQERLRYVNKDWKASFLVATDVHGRVIARAGLDEETWKDDLSAYPVVAEALRGYRLDDAWDLDGKLYRVCATPVIAHDKYVGSLLVGHELGTELAIKMRDALGVDVAFLVRGKVVGHSSQDALLDTLPALAKTHAAEIGPDKHSGIIPTSTEDGSYGVVLAPVDGEAAANEGLYVLVAERRIVGTPIAAVRGVGPHDLRWTDLAAACAALALALIGLLAVWWEHDRPVDSLHRELQAIARGEQGRIEEHGYAPAFRAVVRAVNHAVTRVSRAAGGPGGRPARSLDLSGSGASKGLDPSGIDLAPSDARPPGLPPLELHGNTGSGRAASEPPVNVSVNVNLSLPDGSIPLATATSSADGSAGSQGMAPMPFRPINLSMPGVTPPQGQPLYGQEAEPPMLAALDQLAAPMRAAGGATVSSTYGSHHGGVPLSGALGSGGAPGGSNGPILLVPPSGPVPAAAGPAHSLPVSLDASGPVAATGDAVGTTPMPTPGPAQRDADNSGLFFAAATGEARAAAAASAGLSPVDEAMMSEELAIYREFLATKRSCGESTDNVTFERFVEKLRKNRDQLISRFHCRSVKFQVYVKDGKAAVKATPIHA